MGNNGIWALEKDPMEFLYGYSVAAELRPETRYDLVVGGFGELVRTPDELRPALVRAFEAGKPALVNVSTDPAVAYPRKTNRGLNESRPHHVGDFRSRLALWDGQGYVPEGPGFGWSRRREAPMEWLSPGPMHRCPIQSRTVSRQDCIMALWRRIINRTYV